MNQELLKELKEAGFPGMTLDGWSAYPTLSELIEACGDSFISLNHWMVDTVHFWQATGGDIGMVGYISYPTVEEAVARLWLALQANERTAKD